MLRLGRLARRRWTGCLVTALLFVQLAIAAHACARSPIGDPPSAMSGMPCAETMPGAVTTDADPAALCAYHCHPDAGQPPLDASPVPLQAPAILQMFVRARERERAPPEAHSIHHCCYRL